MSPQAWAYARVSSEEQARGQSIDSQVRRLQDAGIPLERIVVEIGSATKGRTSELQRLFAHAKRGEVSSITAIRQDRIQRTRKVAAQLWELIDEYNVAFRFLDQPDIDAADPPSVFQAQILGAAAQFETQQLSQRVKNGIAQNRMKIQHHGPAPFGYSKHNKRLIPHPDEWDIARQVVECYIETTSSTASRALRHRLTGKTPSTSSFARWLQSPTIRGAVVFDAKSDHPEIHWGQHPALISAAEYDQLKAIRLSNRTNGGSFRKATQPTIGTGLLVCGHCGGKLARLLRKNAREHRDIYRCQRVKDAGCERGHLNWVKRDAVSDLIRRCIRIAAVQIADRETPLTMVEPPELQALREECDGLLKVNTARTKALAAEVDLEIEKLQASLQLSSVERGQQIEQELCRLASEATLRRMTEDSLRSVALRYGLQMTIVDRQVETFEFQRLALSGVLG